MVILLCWKELKTIFLSNLWARIINAVLLIYGKLMMDVHNWEKAYLRVKGPITVLPWWLFLQKHVVWVKNMTKLIRAKTFMKNKILSNDIIWICCRRMLVSVKTRASYSHITNKTSQNLRSSQLPLFTVQHFAKTHQHIQIDSRTFLHLWLGERSFLRP